MNRKEYMRQFGQSEIGKKLNRISRWKISGLIGNYEEIYEKYLNTTHCEKCNVEFSKSQYVKCMDHCHKTGKFRNILCHFCNTQLRENQKNKSNHRGIYFIKAKNLWMYQKRYKNKIIFQKRCKCKITLLAYKFCYLLLFKRLR